MANCLQTDTQTILEHGQSVWDHTSRLIFGNFEGFRLPTWFTENHHVIVNNIHRHSIIRDYNLFHDCGKPFCLEYSFDGSRHFPNHAKVSETTWLEYSDNQQIAELIGLDMLFHTGGIRRHLIKKPIEENLIDVDDHSVW